MIATTLAAKRTTPLQCSRSWEYFHKHRLYCCFWHISFSIFLQSHITTWNKSQPRGHHGGLKHRSVEAAVGEDASWGRGWGKEGNEMTTGIKIGRQTMWNSPTSSSAIDWAHITLSYIPKTMSTYPTRTHMRPCSGIHTTPEMVMFNDFEKKAITHAWQR